MQRMREQQSVCTITICFESASRELQTNVFTETVTVWALLYHGPFPVEGPRLSRMSWNE